MHAAARPKTGGGRRLGRLGARIAQVGLRQRGRTAAGVVALAAYAMSERERVDGPLEQGVWDVGDHGGRAKVGGEDVVADD
ncbi:hypothetical protein JK361_39515 [Streptomyces sp. 5-8]|uniref:Uncharacterized protein n=1 Tax=Streptomyces musisoli TaxID=2802280 RepID=A0ABS1PDW1_9ACTN|nr:hypothetical protein [Streptomyces musisoli]MBL1110567.1 hypothetical protein [Streptomyces musisoli]